MYLLVLNIYEYLMIISLLLQLFLLNNPLAFAHICQSRCVKDGGQSAVS